MTINVYVASAFSKNQQGGNKAGVVLNEAHLSTMQKMAIAKHMGYAETAFVTASDVADYKLEYFTPKDEVDLCGHATIGAFVVLMHLQLLQKTHYTIQTNSGILDITIDGDAILMQQNTPIFYDVIAIEELADCFDANAIYPQHPIQIVSTGLKDILVPIKSTAALHDLTPNFASIKAISQQYGVIGMHLYALDGERIICRNFAPLYDIDEEAATGTSNGALACYLHQQMGLAKTNFVFEQGYALQSPSEIFVQLASDVTRQIDKVLVGGKGYYCETQCLDVDAL